MIPQLAAVACIVFVAYLFRQDVKANPTESKALWVPLLWMFIAGSRWASSWLNLSPPMDSADDYSEGSPIDRAVFLALLVAGVVILARRNIEWGRLLRQNKLLLVYFLYCLLSITWSDEPFVAFKRWFKDLGNPVMVLVILTTPNPLQALTQTLRRLSFLLLPLSVLFVRYYPDLGRTYHFGAPMYTGVGHQKNDLGLMCLITGIYFSWQLLQDRPHFAAWSRPAQWRIYALAAMAAWLLYMSNSQTALSCLVVAAAVLIAGRLPYVRRNPSRLVGLLVLGCVAFAALEAVFDIKNLILDLLGRDPSLTNRADLWRLLFSVNTDPVFGSGFMSFWSGERMARVWHALGGGVNQAHSGYIEQYLNLGYVGVAFIVLLLLSALLDARERLNSDPSMAMLQVCFILVAALYNYTEASFYGINNMWVLLLLAVIKVPEPLAAPTRTEVGPTVTTEATASNTHFRPTTHTRRP